MQDYKTLNKESFDKYKHDNRFIHEVNYAHGVQGWEEYKLAMTKYSICGKDFAVTPEQIKKARMIYNERKQAILKAITPNKLVFVGMGMEFTPKNPDYINNHRIRTYFLNNTGVLCFVEFGTSSDKDFLRVDHALINTKNNEEWNSLTEREQTEIRVKGLEKIRGDYHKYTKKEVLNLVNNHFNCNFKELEVHYYFLDTYDYNCISEDKRK